MGHKVTLKVLFRRDTNYEITVLISSGYTKADIPEAERGGEFDSHRKLIVLISGACCSSLSYKWPPEGYEATRIRKMKEDNIIQNYK